MVLFCIPLDTFRSNHMLVDRPHRAPMERGVEGRKRCPLVQWTLLQGNVINITVAWELPRNAQAPHHRYGLTTQLLRAPMSTQPVSVWNSQLSFDAPRSHLISAEFRDGRDYGLTLLVSFSLILMTMSWCSPVWGCRGIRCVWCVVLPFGLGVTAFGCVNVRSGFDSQRGGFCLCVCEVGEYLLTPVWIWTWQLAVRFDQGGGLNQSKRIGLRSMIRYLSWTGSRKRILLKSPVCVKFDGSWDTKNRFLETKL